MNKLTAREVQVFAGGAFALSGLYAVLWLPYYTFSARDVSQIIAHIITALSLPLGIGILAGSARAMLLTQIYLWLIVITGCIGIPLLTLAMPTQAAHFIWRHSPDFFASVILLSLLVWSHSKRFRNEPGA